LCNTDKQRREARVIEETQSIWSYIFSNSSQFINPDYTIYSSGPLWINTQIGKMQIWERFFARWDSNAHPNLFLKQQWHDDWGNGYETNIDNDTERSLYKYVGNSPKKVDNDDNDQNNDNKKREDENNETSIVSNDQSNDNDIIKETLEYNPSESDDRRS
jgi:hypothetical protein